MERFFNTAGPQIPEDNYNFDQLIDKLKEPRVKRVIEPMLANSPEADDSLIKSIKVCLYNDFSHVHTIITATWGYILNNENLF